MDADPPVYGVKIACRFTRRNAPTSVEQAKQAPPNEERKTAEPKTIQQLSKSDFSGCLKISTTFNVLGSNEPADVHLCINSNYHSKFLVFHIPFTEHTAETIRELSGSLGKFIDNAQSSLRVFSRDPGDHSAVDFSTIPFVNRVVIYHNQNLSLQEMAQLEEHYKNMGVTLVLRGQSYATTQWLLERAKDP